MKMSFFNRKVRISLIAFCLLLIGVLFFLSFFYAQEQLLYQADGTFFPVNIEEKMDETLLTTFRMEERRAVRTLTRIEQATLIGTNENYAAILGLRMLSGGFFTQNAVQMNLQHTVLNQSAAHAWFGGSPSSDNR